MRTFRNETKWMVLKMSCPKNALQTRQIKKTASEKKGMRVRGVTPSDGPRGSRRPERSQRLCGVRSSAGPTHHRREQNAAASCNDIMTQNAEATEATDRMWDVGYTPGGMKWVTGEC